MKKVVVVQSAIIAVLFTEDEIRAAGIDPTLRAEALDVNAFVALANAAAAKKA